MDARDAPKNDTGEGLRIIVRPHRVLTLRNMLLLFAGQTTVVLIIGIGFTLMGAWPVLPFAGLEMTVVAAVLYRLHRHADDHDLVAVEGERITVIRRRGKREWRDEFQRYWMKITLERSRGWYPSRLKLGSHGRFVIIAAEVNEEERESLSTTLNNALRKSGSRGGYERY